MSGPRLLQPEGADDEPLVPLADLADRVRGLAAQLRRVREHTRERGGMQYIIAGERYLILAASTLAIAGLAEDDPAFLAPADPRPPAPEQPE